MKDLLKQLKSSYPDIQYKIRDKYCWSPTELVVGYPSQRSYSDKFDEWSLLHETSHAILGHKHYSTDLELLFKEVEAWETAVKIGKQYGIVIDDDHIQDCLDTYRDWLYKRSKCPECACTGLQHDQNTYKCINCQTAWSVTAERFNRPYRKTLATESKLIKDNAPAEIIYN